MTEAKKLEKHVANIVKIIFIAIILFLFFISIFNNSFVNKKEYTEYKNDYFIVHIVSIASASVLAAFIKNKHLKISKKTLIIFTIIWIVLCVLWVSMTQFKPRADQKYTLNSALQMKEGNYSSLNKGGYLYMNPHQYGLTLYFYMLSFIFNENTFLAVQILNILALLIGFYSMYKIVKLFYDDENISRYTMLGLLLYVPIAMYITFIYGNIIGFTCSTLAIMFEVYYLKNEKKRNIAGMLIFAALAIAFKSNYLICLIAMIMLLMLESFFRKKIKYIFPVIIICLSYLLSLYGVRYAMKTITKIDANEGIPNIAYVAMGMQEGHMAPGWYNEYNRKVYRKSKFDNEVATEKSKENIKERIEVFKKDPKYALEFYYKKTASQWNNPTFQSIWVNQNRKAGVKKNRVVNSILKNNKMGKALVEYMNILQSLILFGALMYFILNYKQIKLIELIFPIVFIGGFLFHIIWEAKCQYTITYFILLIPYAVVGYKIIGVKLTKLYNTKIKKVKYLES
ncbi:MAG: glycosyltransferase family 39 protein [Clostridia bacterium]|nr:glycosyltransferase family 39 protein [Clostridia bacterium]